MYQALQLQPALRKDSDFHNVQLNESTYDILSLIFEFKIAASWHISRFLIQKDQSKHVYSKLRRMWQGGLLENFKVFNGSITGMPVYYLLSKEGLRMLEKKGLYTNKQIRQYPKHSTVLLPNFFKHEAPIVELASMEAKIAKGRTDKITLTFKGEISSSVHDTRYDSFREYNIEVFTPDYTVHYDSAFMTQSGRTLPVVYTEYERTPKSKDAILKKIDRYLSHVGYLQQKDCILRIIFETEAMEMSFWKTMILSGPTYGRQYQMQIMTTNIATIASRKENTFCEPLYVNHEEVEIIGNGRMEFFAKRRIKLFVIL